ncbi:MAG: septum formation initiator family protein [Methylacidiphilales bacterium]|nr:septum formation initiator family protein [Candidatus Methylacidiphilales bacterium]
MLIISIVIIILLFIPQIKQMNEFQAKRDRIAELIRQERQKQLDLQNEIYLIQHSPHYFERLVRDRLNLAKPGEVIFRFDPYPTPQTSRTP